MHPFPYHESFRTERCKGIRVVTTRAANCYGVINQGIINLNIY